MTVWLVRAGSSGEREDFALKNSVAVIGWDDLADLSKVKTKEELFKKIKITYTDEKLRTLQNWSNQLWSFIDGIKVDDLVVLPLKSQPAIAVGEVKGNYHFNKDTPSDAHHSRPVKWIKTDISRSRFDQDLLYSMGAFLTVCRIKRNNAEERIKAVVYGKQLPKREEVIQSEEIELPDLEQYSLDQIQKYISQKFKGHEFTRLIAEILKAQGYRVHISPEGPDGGIDILAGTGHLGFDEPRLAVQVKSSDNPIDIETLRGLRGVLHHFGAKYGLLVSWGGFKQSVLRDSRTSYFEIRLWNANDVVQNLQNNYDKLPENIQTILPLKRIWTLVKNDIEDE